jgi:hypothetical protein
MYLTSVSFFFYAMKKNICILLLIIGSFTKITLCQTSRSNSEYEFKVDNNKCKEQIVNLSGNVFLGTLFNGTQGFDLPTSDGNGNAMEFEIKGKSEHRYLVSTSFENTTTDGSIVIDNWSWVFLESNNTQSDRFDNQQNVNKEIKLNKSKEDDCESGYKIKLILSHLKLSNTVQQGEHFFTVTISLSEF